MRRPPAGRLVALLGVVVLALAGVGTRLVVLQVGDHRAFAEQGLDQRVHLIDLPAERGAIVDRTGVPLAITLEARDVYADPRYVTDPIGEAARIARILDLQPRQVERLLRTPDSTFVYLGRQVD
ncbi:MAG TPA: penicillin-binding protein 2, partial [Actinomycetota bacterium]